MRGTIVYLDSSSVIKRYIKEPGSARIRDIYLKAYSGELALAFSGWNLGEVLGALDKARAQNRLDREKYITSKRRFLLDTKRLVKLGMALLIPVKTGLLVEGWKLIERYHIYQADALQIVSAKAINASEFLTGDKGLDEIARAENLNSTYVA
jgi:predicted nucleic acid-binding protein